jgi:hypothetical protein
LASSWTTVLASVFARQFLHRQQTVTKRLVDVMQVFQ